MWAPLVVNQEEAFVNQSLAGLTAGKLWSWFPSQGPAQAAARDIKAVSIENWKVEATEQGAKVVSSGREYKTTILFKRSGKLDHVTISSSDPERSGNSLTFVYDRYNQQAQRISRRLDAKIIEGLMTFGKIGQHELNELSSNLAALAAMPWQVLPRDKQILASNRVCCVLETSQYCHPYKDGTRLILTRTREDYRAGPVAQRESYVTHMMAIEGYMSSGLAGGQFFELPPILRSYESFDSHSLEIDTLKLRLLGQIPDSGRFIPAFPGADKEVARDLFRLVHSQYAD